MPNSGVANAQVPLPILGEQADQDNNNLSHSSNGNDDGAGAEAEEDAIAGLKPEFEAQPFAGLQNRLSKPTGFNNTVCNFNSHV